ncbi:MAG: DUF2336 domain-containing protein [Alphaproteobacteria bacterium]|nr:DUF2336 domain-containing protein [Alphaproteobacteria bacterium]
MAPNEPKITQEISSLLKLAYDREAGSRSELFKKITDFLERRHTDMTPNGLELMSEILEKLLINVEMSVRQKLADRLAEDENAPLDLIILLANDQIDVAGPVLKLSELLSDKELVNIIRHKTAQHQLSIAGRAKLSSDVCRELVTVGNDKTLIVLLNNRDAKIGNQSLANLVEKSKNNIPIQPPLIERPDLPKEMTAKMYQWVSESLKESILTKLNMSEMEIDKFLNSAIQEVAQEGGSHITKEKSEILLVNKLHKAGKLTPAFLMKCLNQGQSSLFEIGFAKLISIPHKIMRSFLYDRGAEALAVSCCAAGIDRSVFLTIYELTRAAQNVDTNLSDTEVAEAFEYFKKLDRKKALHTIQKWVAEATGAAIF